MKTNGLLLLAAAGFASSVLAGSGPINFKPYAQRIPAMPATSVAAAASFKSGAKVGDIVTPAALTQLRQEMKDAGRRTAESDGAEITSDLTQMTPEQAQALQERMQNASQAEQMAMAMQLQQTMMRGGGGFSLSDEEAAAQEKLDGEKDRVTADSQRWLGLRQKIARQLSDWDAAEAKLDASLGFTSPTRQHIDPVGGVFCSEASRRKTLDAASAQMALADRQLPLAAALEKELRAELSTLFSRSDLTAKLLGQIQTPAGRRGVETINARAYGNSFEGLDVLAGFYADVGRRAAAWPQLRAVWEKTPVKPQDPICLYDS